jgi:hypothetical protein
VFAAQSIILNFFAASGAGFHYGEFTTGG